MIQCHACPGFIPAALTQCPHCGSAPRNRLLQRIVTPIRRVLQLLLGASVTMTLAACYGAPPPMPQPCDDKEDGMRPCPSPSPSGSATPSPSASPSPGASASPAAN